MKIDPYAHKEKFLNWKKKVQDGIPEISKANSDVLLKYISDMELGLNISAKSTKGARSYIRLNNIKQRMIFLTKHFERLYGTQLIDLSEEQVFAFFNDMRNGTIKRQDGKEYMSVVDFVKPFKAFWHWHMKVQKKKGIKVKDITEDLDVSAQKPKWVYLTEDDIRKLCKHALPKYRVLIMFLYDTGIRSPGELINIRVSDLYDDCKQLNIRDEIVKKGSFGRKIHLMMCVDLLKDYIKESRLQSNDQLFKICPRAVNRYLKRLAIRILGDKESMAGKRYSNLSMYDFRHCSCCYWLPRYDVERALMYRFGWKKSDKINYYSELLGMRDTINEDDMLLGATKTEIEKRLQKAERENNILREQFKSVNNDVAKVKDLLKTLMSKMITIEEMQKYGAIFTVDAL